jgi:NADH dehydrogenase
MKVLVTGGTGVVGRAAVDHLLAAGHTVRLLSRHADEDVRRWASGVEAHPGSVTRDADVAGAADGCGAVLHVAGIVAEDPPEATFQAVNVEGTRRLVREAARAGVRRFVYVSSLGAEQGESAYHRSKLEAEEVVRAEFAGDWLVLRPGNVYGPGDGVVSLLLKMARTLPAVPVVGGGDHEFQPVWAEDVGEALARAVDAAAPARTSLDLAGPQRTTLHGLLDAIEKLTGRSPVRVPVPELVARAGTGLAGLLGVDFPVTADQLTMLAEENVIPEGRPNALDVLGVPATPLVEGLAKLADAIPEHLPEDGTGSMHRERFWADVEGSSLGPEEMLALVCDQFAALAPDTMTVSPEPQPAPRMEPGATMTLGVPLRGHVQVRVQEVTPRAITAVTLEGHFFAGVIRFMADEPRPGVVRFEVRTYNRAADLVDRVAMRTLGKAAQLATWQGFVEEVVRRSGGTAPGGVQSEDVAMPEEDAGDVERWVAELVMERRRQEPPTSDAEARV